MEARFVDQAEGKKRDILPGWWVVSDGLLFQGTFASEEDANSWISRRHGKGWPFGNTSWISGAARLASAIILEIENGNTLVATQLAHRIIDNAKFIRRSTIASVIIATATFALFLTTTWFTFDIFPKREVASCLNSADVMDRFSLFKSDTVLNIGIPTPSGYVPVGLVCTKEKRGHTEQLEAIVRAYGKRFGELTKPPGGSDMPSANETQSDQPNKKP
jgi:hypothetical protein